MVNFEPAMDVRRVSFSSVPLQTGQVGVLVITQPQMLSTVSESSTLANLWNSKENNVLSLILRFVPYFGMDHQGRASQLLIARIHEHQPS